MTSYINPAVWGDRWDALNQTIDNCLGELHEAGPKVPKKQADTLRYLFEYLQQFALRQFNHFRDGFSEGTRTLERYDKYPDE